MEKVGEIFLLEWHGISEPYEAFITWDAFISWADTRKYEIKTYSDGFRWELFGYGDANSFATVRKIVAYK